MDIFPNFGATGGAEELQKIVGALLTFALIIAVLMMAINGITWALASSHGNFQSATKARVGLWVSCGAAAPLAPVWPGSTFCSTSARLFDGGQRLERHPHLSRAAVMVRI